jgi:hypothetical protein
MNIEYCSKLLSLILFADDTTIFHSNSCLKTLNTIIQTELNKVEEWLNVNKFSLNIRKTKFILITNKKPKLDMKININNEEIEQVKCTTFLGIIIDECLTWKDHINKIAQLITKASGMIAKIRHCMSRNALKLIYYALVYPYLIYTGIWCGVIPTTAEFKKL